MPDGTGGREGVKRRVGEWERGRGGIKMQGDKMRKACVREALQMPDRHTPKQYREVWREVQRSILAGIKMAIKAFPASLSVRSSD